MRNKLDCSVENLKNINLMTIFKQYWILKEHNSSPKYQKLLRFTFHQLVTLFFRLSNDKSFKDSLVLCEIVLQLREHI